MVKWLDEDFFKAAISSGYNEDGVEVDQFSLRLGTKDGENYASSIYRCIVSYKIHERVVPRRELIVKTITGKVNSLADDVSYEIEVDVYKNVVEKMREMLRKINNSWCIAPKMLYCRKDPAPVMVFEDAHEKEYKKIKMRLGLDNVIFVAKKLGQWHALSLCLHANSKMSLERYNRGLFNLKGNDGLNFFHETLNIFINVLTEWNNCEQYVRQLQSIYDRFMDLGAKIYQPQTNGYNVLCHGDFHYNNFLVKYDENKTISDILFLDFQMAVFASPTIDLIYLLYLVASDEARAHREDIIKSYHDEFTSLLLQIGYKSKIPTLDDLENEMHRHGFMEIVLAVCCVPFLYVDRIKTEFSTIVSQDNVELRKQLFNTNEYKSFIMPLLEQLLEKGILDA